MSTDTIGQGNVFEGRVLVVDDSPTNLMVIGSQLEAQGCHVTTATNGREAIELILSQSFDMVFMDLLMPELSGLETVQALRQQQIAIPIVAITGKTDPRPRRSLRKEPMGLIAALATVAMLFAAFTAAYLIRRTSPDWVALDRPATLPWGIAALAISSVTAELARRRRSARLLWITAGLGVLFLVLQGMAWGEFASAGMLLPTHPHSSFFYMLTAIHGLHILGGLGALIYAAVRDRYHGESTFFWHFLGVLWLYLVVLLFVAG